MSAFATDIEPTPTPALMPEVTPAPIDAQQMTGQTPLGESMATPEQTAPPEQTDYEKVVALYEGLPAADSITEQSTDAEKEDAHNQVGAFLTAYAELSDEDKAQFIAAYGDPNILIQPLVDAITGAAPATAATVDVSDPSGLQNAINNATAGDTIVLKTNCTGTFTINKNITLDLNGYTITGNTYYYSVITISPSCEVTITDGKGGGTITRQAGLTAIAQCGGGIWIDSNAKLTMTGGSITGCISNPGTAVGTGGGGVYVGDNATFIMSGGSITNCEAKGNMQGGGGVYVDNGAAFTMTGGSISNCKAVYGGGVFVDENAEFILDGGTITGCTVTQIDYDNGGEGGGIYLGRWDTYGDYGSARLVSGEISGNNAARNGGGIYVAEDAVNYSGCASLTITDALFDGNNSTWYSDGEVLYDDSGWGIKSYANHGAVVTARENINIKELRVGSDYDEDLGETLPFKYAMDGTLHEWTKTSRKINSYNSEYFYDLENADEIKAVKETFEAAGLFKVYITNNSAGYGGGIYNAGDLTIGKQYSTVTFLNEDGTVFHTAKNVKEGTALSSVIPTEQPKKAGHIFDGWIPDPDGLYKLAENGAKVVVDITLVPTWTINENAVAHINGTEYPSLQAAVDAAKDGDTVQLLARCGKATVNSKNIIIDLNGCTIQADIGVGTALTVNGGSNVTVTDSSTGGTGKIANSSARGGGGLRVEGSGTTVTWEKGSIEKCSSHDAGGGVHVTDGAEFIMTGGTIKDCESQSSISGGGICADNGAQVTLSGGTIEGCTAIDGTYEDEGRGGGVNAMGEGTNLTLTGSTIKGCTAKNGGGGIYIGSGASLLMDGGRLESNHTNWKGGGLCVGSDGTAVITAGHIRENTTGDLGGGIYIEGDGAVVPGSCTITDVLIQNTQAIAEPIFAQSDGGYGVDTCEVGNTFIYAEHGAVIDSNKGKTPDSVLLSDIKFQLDVADKDVSEGRGVRYIADEALGGATYNWYDTTTEQPLGGDPKPWQNPNDRSELYMYHHAENRDSDPIAQAADSNQFKVYIVDNQTVYYWGNDTPIPYANVGGAISNNGDLVIGVKPGTEPDPGPGPGPEPEPEPKPEPEPGDAALRLAGRKLLLGRDPLAGEFAFALYRADEDFAPIGEPLAIAMNEADGRFFFPEITLDRAGIYRYVLCEQAGTDSHIVYDTAEYQITVGAQKNPNGTLSLLPPSLERSIAGERETVREIVFTNAVRLPEVPKTGEDASPWPGLAMLFLGLVAVAVWRRWGVSIRSM